VEGATAAAEPSVTGQYRNPERRDSAFEATDSGDEADDGNVSSASVGSESSQDKQEQGRSQTEVDSSSNRRQQAPQLRRTATDAAPQRFFADAYTQDVLYPGLFLEGDPPDYVTFLTDEVTGRPQHSNEFQVGPDYGNVKLVKRMGQGPHDPRLAEKKSEYRWGELTCMVSNLGHSRYPLIHLDVTVPVQRLKHTMSWKNIKALYVAWLESGMRCPLRDVSRGLHQTHHGALSQPQAMIVKEVHRLYRQPEDCSWLTVDPLCEPIFIPSKNTDGRALNASSSTGSTFTCVRVAALQHLVAVPSQSTRMTQHVRGCVFRLYQQRWTISLTNTTRRSRFARGC
jgi:hypothetical protein